MRKPLSVLELQRVSYVNSLMNHIHENTDDLYESLMDGELSQARHTAEELLIILRDVADSLDESLNSH